MDNVSIHKSKGFIEKLSLKKYGIIYSSEYSLTMNLI